MRFYGREKELATLRRIREESLGSARFTVLTGRRRIGKTELLREAFADKPNLYFFVARRSEAELCENFTVEIEEKLGIPIPGIFTRVSDILAFLLKIAETRHFTLVIDEFQELLRIDPGAFSSLQRDWDAHKRAAKINLVVSGSVNRLMNRIFRDRHEPLYGRQTGFIKLAPFSIAELKAILHANSQNATNDDLLALYGITGGIAKYVELLMDAGACTLDLMLEVIFREDSTFLDEGRACLGDEFGKDYGNYFSILSSIAIGRNSRGEIEAAIGGGEVGGYLKNLIADYGLVARRQPLFAKPAAKNIRYAIDDNFFLFWFRFIAKYGHILEIGGHERLKELVKRDYEVFSGIMLERYFRRKFAETGDFTQIGSWWDRKGENEIDLIAEDELEKRVVFAEVKRSARRFSMPLLRQKVEAFLRSTGSFKNYAIEYASLSLDDM